MRPLTFMDSRYQGDLRDSSCIGYLEFGLSPTEAASSLSSTDISADTVVSAPLQRAYNSFDGLIWFTQYETMREGKQKWQM